MIIRSNEDQGRCANRSARFGSGDRDCHIINVSAERFRCAEVSFQEFVQEDPGDDRKCGKSMEVDIKNHKSFNSDFIEQLGATHKPLDAVTRSMAESDVCVAKAMKIRQDEHSETGPRHNQVAGRAVQGNSS